MECLEIKRKKVPFFSEGTVISGCSESVEPRLTAGAKTCSQWVFRGTSGHCSSKLNSYPKNVHDLWDCRYMQQK